MNDDVESHEFPESLVLESEHVCVVGTVIKSGVGLRNVLHVFVGVVEDNGGNSGNAGAHIKSIFEGRVPVLALVDTITVSLSELAERLASEDSHGELSHGVHGLGEALDQGFDIGRDLTAVEDLSLELLKLTCGGELASEEEPKGSLREGL